MQAGTIGILLTCFHVPLLCENRCGNISSRLLVSTCNHEMKDENFNSYFTDAKERLEHSYLKTNYLLLFSG